MFDSRLRHLVLVRRRRLGLQYAGKPIAQPFDGIGTAADETVVITLTALNARRADWMDYQSHLLGINKHPTSNTTLMRHPYSTLYQLAVLLM